MNSKVPEIEKTVSMIQALNMNQGKKQTQVDFMLSEGIYVKAKAKENTDKVALWLGAQTIVELTFEEAEKLLS